MKIPIIVGVTGHRNLREEDIPRLRELVRAELQSLQGACPHSPVVMLNSLAAGADRLCAEAAVELGIALKCPLPMAEDEYRRDFAGEDLVLHEAILSNAEEVFVAPAAEAVPEQPNRGFWYRQAGLYVAAHSHVLLALWDGSPAEPNGHGTAETVDFMLRGSCEESFRAENDGAVIHILTQRQGSGKETALSVKLLENEPGGLHKILNITDTYNKDAESLPHGADSGDALLPKEYLDGRIGLSSLNALHRKADALALRFQAQYLRAMRCFSLFAVGLVLFFLLYDELESDLFLLGYGLLILLYFLAFLFSRRTNIHMKYLQYRTLSEAMRVQFYLSAAGFHENIGNAFTWTQKLDSTWVKKAVSALLAGASEPVNVPGDLIQARLIDGQLAYHQHALKRTARQRRINEGTSRVMLLCSVALFAAVLVLEFFFDSAVVQPVITEPLPAFLLHHTEQEFTLRSLMKILLGGVSAAAVFVSNYYGKLSLERKSLDHEKMALLYAAAKKRFESGRVNRSRLFRELAREEIIENGNWFSYCRENPPPFSL